MPWPRYFTTRVHHIDETLRTTRGPHTAKSLPKQFTLTSETDITEIYEALDALGRNSMKTTL
jgi:hypothetical protein